jgi:hypothetical protein
MESKTYYVPCVDPTPGIIGITESVTKGLFANFRDDYNKIQGTLRNISGPAACMLQYHATSHLPTMLRIVSEGEFLFLNMNEWEDQLTRSYELGLGIWGAISGDLPVSYSAEVLRHGPSERFEELRFELGMALKSAVPFNWVLPFKEVIMMIAPIPLHIQNQDDFPSEGYGGPYTGLGGWLMSDCGLIMSLNATTNLSAWKGKVDSRVGDHMRFEESDMIASSTGWDYPSLFTAGFISSVLQDISNRYSVIIDEDTDPDPRTASKKKRKTLVTRRHVNRVIRLETTIRKRSSGTTESTGTGYTLEDRLRIRTHMRLLVRRGPLPMDGETQAFLEERNYNVLTTRNEEVESLLRLREKGHDLQREGEWLAFKEVNIPEHYKGPEGAPKAQQIRLIPREGEEEDA